MNRTRPLLFALAVFVLVGSAAAAAGGPDSPALPLIHILGCKGCHVLQNEGGSLGSPLDKFDKHLSRQDFLRQLTVPRTRNPQAKMPAYDYLSPEELKLLADFFVPAK